MKSEIIIENRNIFPIIFEDNQLKKLVKKGKTKEFKKVLKSFIKSFIFFHLLNSWFFKNQLKNYFACLCLALILPVRLTK